MRIACACRRVCSYALKYAWGPSQILALAFGEFGRDMSVMFYIAPNYFKRLVPCQVARGIVAVTQLTLTQCNDWPKGSPSSPRTHMFLFITFIIHNYSLPIPTSEVLKRNRNQSQNLGAELPNTYCSITLQVASVLVPRPSGKSKYWFG